MNCNKYGRKQFHFISTPILFFIWVPVFVTTTCCIADDPTLTSSSPFDIEIDQVSTLKETNSSTVQATGNETEMVTLPDDEITDLFIETDEKAFEENKTEYSNVGTNHSQTYDLKLSNATETETVLEDAALDKALDSMNTDISNGTKSKDEQKSRYRSGRDFISSEDEESEDSPSLDEVEVEYEEEVSEGYIDETDTATNIQVEIETTETQSQTKAKTSGTVLDDVAISLANKNQNLRGGSSERKQGLESLDYQYLRVLLLFVFGLFFSMRLKVLDYSPKRRKD